MVFESPCKCPSVRWHCWLGVRKSIRPVIGVVTVWSKLQMICIWSSWCHCQCHPIISCFIKIQIDLTFLVPAYPGCLKKRYRCLSINSQVYKIFNSNQVKSRLTGECLLLLNCCSMCSKSRGFPITSVTSWNNKRKHLIYVLLEWSSKERI